MPAHSHIIRRSLLTHQGARASRPLLFGTAAGETPTLPSAPSAAHRVLSAFIAIGLAATAGITSAQADEESEALTTAESNTYPNGRAPMPSRLVSDSEIEAYLAQIVASLPMSTRRTDPFGAIQDPDAAPPPPPIADFAAPTPTAPAIPFSDVISRIKITTVMPGEGRFLLGTRSFRINDIIPVNFRGETFQVRVDEVNANRIRFRNMANNETANLELNMLPAGLSRGAGPNPVPGMTRAGANNPIQLD